MNGDGRLTVIASVAAGVLACTSMLAGRSALAVDTKMIELSDRLLDQTQFELCVSKLSVKDFESSHVLDKMEFVRQERRHLTEGVDVLALLVGAIVRLALTLLLLGSVDIRLLALLVVGIVVVRINRWGSGLRSAGLVKASSHHRRAATMCDMFKDESVAFELRSFGHAPHLLSGARADFRESLRHSTHANLKAVLVAALGWLVFGVGYAAALYWVAEGFIGGQATAGGVVLAVLLVSSITTQLGSLVFFSTALMRVAAVGEAFGDLLEAGHASADAPSCVVDPAGAGAAPSADRGLEVDHVSFRYQGSGRLALDDINVTVAPGSVVALVGENGAGKSTLVKLFLGLYEPDAGSIRVAGDSPVSRVGTHQISAAFQDFTRFEFSLRDVVGCGDVRDPAPERILSSLDAADGMTLLDELPDGLDTRLGNSFADGRQLSGGQWQKTALARSLMPRDVVLLSLDEPTAAVDPLSEARLLRSYFRHARELATQQGTIIIIVTHRLNSIEIADLVLYMEDGRITERGTHAELMRLNGGYADLFNTQRKAYAHEA
ncbi:MAG: ABC transporter ATP-binding protein/permease [Bifidobacteriaceae bacterium]|nr:ABC transporter ATP-binding protein/permease [Bifidobacteriaceae bacterium]